MSHIEATNYLWARRRKKCQESPPKDIKEKNIQVSVLKMMSLNLFQRWMFGIHTPPIKVPFFFQII